MDGMPDISNWLLNLGNDAGSVRLLFVILLAFVGFSLALTASMIVNAIFNPVKKRIVVVQNENAPKESSQSTKKGFGTSTGSSPSAKDRSARGMNQVRKVCSLTSFSMCSRTSDHAAWAVEGESTRYLLLGQKGVITKALV